MHKNHFIPCLPNPPPNPRPPLLEAIHKIAGHNIPPLERIGNMGGRGDGHGGKDDVCGGGGGNLGSYF